MKKIYKKYNVFSFLTIFLCGLIHFGTLTTKATINHEYLSLLDQMENFRLFTKKNSTVYHQENGDKMYNQISYTKNQGVAQNFYAYTADLVYGKVNIDEYLRSLLLYRFATLRDRINKILDYDYDLEENAYLIPTDKKLFNFYIEDKDSKYRLLCKNIKDCSLQADQIITLLLKTTFEFISCKSKLSRITLYIIAAAQHLHDILTGERQDLGHLDEHEGYALLKPFFIACKQDKYLSSMPFLCHLRIAKKILQDAGCNSIEDLLNYKVNLELSAESEEEKKIQAIVLNKKLVDNKKQKALLEFRKVYIPNSDLFMFEGHFKLRPRVFYYQGMGANQTYKKLMTDYAYHQLIKDTPKECLPRLVKIEDPRHSHTRWPYPLPSIAHLFPEEQKAASPLYKKPIPTSRLVKNPRPQLQQSVNPEMDVEDAKVEEDLQPVRKTISQTIVPSNAQASHPPKSTPHQPTLAEVYQPEQKTNHTSLKPKKKKNQPQATSIAQEEKEEAQAIQSFACLYDKALPPYEVDFEGYGLFEVPKGVRSYFPNNIEPLRFGVNETQSHSYRKIIQQLFEPRKKDAGKVTFDEIKNIVEGMGGKLEKNGGSHNTFIDPEDRKLWTIMRPHDNKNYQGRPYYIPILQFTLLYLGLRPMDYFCK